MFLIAASVGLSALLMPGTHIADPGIETDVQSVSFRLESLSHGVSPEGDEIVVHRPHADRSLRWRVAPSTPTSSDLVSGRRHIDHQQLRAGRCVIAAEDGLRCVTPLPAITLTFGD